MEPNPPILNSQALSADTTAAVQQPSTEVCPYLQTVRRNLLDFDFEKVCCVSLTNVNVYGCLVCGRYFQGKGRSTHAFTHALEAGHHLFINLTTCAIYCLPDGYEVKNASLDDVKYNLQPTYQQESLQQLDNNIEARENLDGKVYVPGCVGLNNLKHTDFINVVVQLIMRVRPIREFCLVGTPKGQLSEKLALLAKKMWNSRNFKGVVSPHEFVQTLSQVSQKKFRIGKEDDPLTFLLWLLNNLDAELKKNHVKNVHVLALFRGRLKTSFFKPLEKSAGYEQLSSKVQQVNFLLLTLQLPQKNKEDLPVVLSSLLNQYLGRSYQDSPEGRRYFLITEYPRFLLLHFKRFSFNGYFKEKNPVIVKFTPLLDLEGRHYRLIGCICHEGPADSSVYKVYVRRAEKWFMLQDLRMEQSRFEEVEVSQAYIQLYERTN